MLKGKCLTKEEAEGVGITKYIISQFSLRPRWVWERYGGLEKWRGNAPSTVKMNFSGTIPLEYEGKLLELEQNSFMAGAVLMQTACYELSSLYGI